LKIIVVDFFFSYLHSYNHDRNFPWTEGKSRKHYWTGTEKYAFISVVERSVVLQVYPSAAELKKMHSMLSKQEV